MENELIEGSIEFYQLNKGLSIQISKFKTQAPFKVSRMGTVDDQLLVLDFHITGNASLNITSVENLSNINGLIHGAYFASSAVESFALFPQGVYNEQFHIILDKKWLQDFFSLEISEVLDKIVTIEPFFMYERLTSEITALLIKLFASKPKTSFRQTYLYGKTLELLALFFTQLKTREENLIYTASNYSDIFNLFELMQYAEDHLDQDLSVQSLATRIGYSESKLQKLSKAVYGKSVSKEITERRMNKALELLGSKKYTIAEVGYKMGYQNMSHFSNAFKKIHGFLPSEYVK